MIFVCLLMQLMIWLDSSLIKASDKDKTPVPWCVLAAAVSGLGFSSSG